MSISQTTGIPVQPAPLRNARRHSRRWLPWLGAVLLVALLVAGLWPQPIPVEIAAVSIGRLQSTVNEEGRTRVKQRYIVAAPVAGMLRRIPLKASACVEAGQVISAIDPPPPTQLDARVRAATEARRDTAIASLAKAKANTAFATSELRRFEQLFKNQAVSTQELETIQLRADAALKDEQAAQSALRQVEAELAEFGPGGALSEGQPILVRSPTNGAVLRVFEESARVVSAGTPLLEIGDPTELEVIIEVLSRDGAAIAPGARVELEQWGGQQLLDARVRLVEPGGFTKVSALGVEEQRVNVIADIITPPEQRKTLGDNFRVEARIIMWEAETALKAPAGALFRKGADWAAFVIEGGRAKLRILRTGRSSGSETQILEGLKEGETLILYPGNRIHNGQRVKPLPL